jgi:hypothetical protein
LNAFGALESDWTNIYHVFLLCGATCCLWQSLP